MDAQVSEQTLLEDLASQPDEALHAVIARARSLLAARKNERQARALATIRRLISENELDCEITRRSRKRGRPRKPRAGEA